MEPGLGASLEILRWIQSVPRDLETLREALLDRGSPASSKPLLIAAMGYRGHPADSDAVASPCVLGETACVIRVATELFIRDSIHAFPLSTLQKLSRLSREARAVSGFLGSTGYSALKEVVRQLPAQPVGALTSAEILADEVVRSHFLKDVERWAVQVSKTQLPVENAPLLEVELRNHLLLVVGLPSL